MLDKYRNKEGFIDLNNTPYTADISERFKLIIDGVGYYFKYTTVAPTPPSPAPPNLNEAT